MHAGDGGGLEWMLLDDGLLLPLFLFFEPFVFTGELSYSFLL